MFNPTSLAPGMFSRRNTLPLVSSSCSVWSYDSSAKCNTGPWGALEHFGSSCEPNNPANTSEWLPHAHQLQHEPGTISSLPSLQRLQSQGMGHGLHLAGQQGHHPSHWVAAGACHTCPSGVCVGREACSVPAGFSATTINNEHEPPCVCGTAEGLSLRTGCAREAGSLLRHRMSNFHPVVFSRTWCSGTALEGKKKRNWLTVLT